VSRAAAAPEAGVSATLVCGVCLQPIKKGDVTATDLVWAVDHGLQLGVAIVHYDCHDPACAHQVPPQFENERTSH
jgi:hypothetical protein